LKCAGVEFFTKGEVMQTTKKIVLFLSAALIPLPALAGAPSDLPPLVAKVINKWTSDYCVGLLIGQVTLEPLSGSRGSEAICHGKGGDATIIASLSKDGRTVEMASDEPTDSVILGEEGVLRDNPTNNEIYGATAAKIVATCHQFSGSESSRSGVDVSDDGLTVECEHVGVGKVIEARAQIIGSRVKTYLSINAATFQEAQGAKKEGAK